MNLEHKALLEILVIANQHRDDHPSFNTIASKAKDVLNEKDPKSLNETSRAYDDITERIYKSFKISEQQVDCDDYGNTSMNWYYEVYDKRTNEKLYQGYFSDKLSDKELIQSYNNFVSENQ